MTARIGAAVAFGTAVVYVILIASQGGASDDLGAVILVTVMIGGAAVAGFVGATASDVGTKRLLLGASTGLLLSLGVLSIFSIGLLLLAAGVLAGLAWGRAMASGGDDGRSRAIGAFLAAAALPLLLIVI